MLQFARVTGERYLIRDVENNSYEKYSITSNMLLHFAILLQPIFSLLPVLESKYFEFDFGPNACKLLDSQRGSKIGFEIYKEHADKLELFLPFSPQDQIDCQVISDLKEFDFKSKLIVTEIGSPSDSENGHNLKKRSQPAANNPAIPYSKRSIFQKYCFL